MVQEVYEMVKNNDSKLENNLDRLSSLFLDIVKEAKGKENVGGKGSDRRASPP